MDKIENIKNIEWTKNWAGRWSILTCSYLGNQYVIKIKEYLKVNLSQCVMVSHRGFSTCYFSKKESEIFSKALSEEVKINNNLALDWCSKGEYEAKNIYKSIEQIRNRGLNLISFKHYIEHFVAFAAWNFAIKKIADYLPQDLLEVFLKRFEKYRVNTEKVYADTEKFMEEIAENLLNIEKEIVLSTLADEFEKFLVDKSLPPKKNLQSRYQNFVIYFYKDKEFYYSREVDIEKIEKFLDKRFRQKLTGQSAYPGIAQGVARVILNPLNYNKFNEGDILVTGMTRSEYLNIVNKSSAFVTDAGGVLCHASITAREIKKPCIVGLESATKMIKSGDIIEVDANSGIVRILR